MAKFCNQCGKELTDEMIFCTNCGTKVYVEPEVQKVEEVQEEKVEAQQEEVKVEEQPTPQPAPIPQPAPAPQPAPIPQPAPQPVYVREPIPTPPPVYVQQTVQSPQPQQDKATKIVGTATFFWFKLLFAIPVVGFILSIIFSFAPKRKSLKNYARATLIWYLIGIIAVAITILVFVLVVGQSASAGFYY